MATVKQNTIAASIGGTVGIAAGMLIHHCKQNKRNAREAAEHSNDIWINTVVGLLLGVLIGLLLAKRFGSKNDTYNYSLYYKGEHVYEGITGVKRLCTRIKEHERDGKKFDRIAKSRPKPRVEAVADEAIQIRKSNPKYNKQHNN